MGNVRTMNGRWQRGLTRRRALAVGAAGSAAALLAACSGGGKSAEKEERAPTQQEVKEAFDKGEIIYEWQAPDETAKAVPGGIYKSYTTGEATTFDPVKSTSFTTQVLAGAVYETLLRFDSGPGIDTTGIRKIEGRLAESYEIAPDAQTVTFKMRPNVKFHNIAPVNGRTMDIEDWRQSLSRFLAQSPFRANLTDIIDKWETPDERTLVLKLKMPYASTARLFTSGSATFWTLPKEAVDGRMNPDTQVIGTYHMQLDKFEPSVTWEYKKHPYWRGGGTPFIDRWHYPIIPEYAQRQAQFIVGNVYEFTPRAQEVLQVRKDAPQTTMYRTPIGTGWGMIFFGYREFETSPWRDERVRKALSMMIDRAPMRAHFSNSEEYKAAGLPQEVRWHSHVKAGWTGYWLNPEKDELGSASQFWKFNVAEAKKLLTAAGHPDGFELPVSYTDTPLYGADHPERCQITMDMWTKAGIRVRPMLMEYQAYLSNVYQKRDFKGVAPHPEFTYVDIDQEVYNTWHSKGGRFKSFPDARVDELVEAQRKELDERKRTTIIHDLQKYMAEKFYWIPWDGTSSGFQFKWPYIRNVAYPGWNQFIAADAPKRNTA